MSLRNCTRILDLVFFKGSNLDEHAEILLDCYQCRIYVYPRSNTLTTQMDKKLQRAHEMTEYNNVNNIEPNLFVHYQCINTNAYIYDRTHKTTKLLHQRGILINHDRQIGTPYAHSHKILIERNVDKQIHEYFTKTFHERSLTELIS